MEDDTFFYGGRIPRIRASIPEIKLKKFKQPTSALEIKKQKQTGRVSAKKASISKVQTQKTATAKFKEGKLADVKAKTSDVERIREADLSSKFENPLFKEKITKVLGEKEIAFGKKLSPDELRAKVESKMNDIRSKADARAKENAASARDNLSNKNNEVTTASKANLSDKIAKLKEDFNNKLNNLRNNLTEIDRQRIRDANTNTKARQTVNAERVNLDGNAKARGDSERFREAGDRARNSADDIDTPQNRGEMAETQRLRETDANIKARDSANAERANLDANTRARGDSERFRESSDRPRDSGEKIEKPRNKGDDPERIRENEARNKANEATNKMRDNLSASERFRNKIKAFLKKILGILGQILMIVLPILIGILPMIIPPPPPPTIPPPPFITLPPPPPIIPPGGSTIVMPLYVPGGPGGPGAPAPPGAPGAPEAAYPPGEGNESYGNIMFQLTDEPSETISFQIESLSDSLEFDQPSITFPLETWNTPIYVNFITTLESSSENIVGDISDKLSSLKQAKKLDKRPNISVGSLNDYSATPQEINAQRKRLEYLMRPSETIEQALSKINKRVRMRKSLVEPTYDGGYDEYRGIVEPTYDDIVVEQDEVVEPTYNSLDYKILEDIVYPSEKVIQEESYEPIDEIVEPVYDSSKYKIYTPTVVPTLDGGQENSNIDSNLDYDAITDEIDETQLDDTYKAEIQFILLEDISSEVNISITIVDPVWTIQPNIITFDADISSTTSFFFSQEIYETLQNLHVGQYANQAEEQFDEYVDNTYESGINSIGNQEQLNKNQEQELYDDVYDRSYQQEMSKVEDAQYVLNQLGGYKKPTLARLYNRTRKLSRIIK